MRFLLYAIVCLILWKPILAQHPHVDVHYTYRLLTAEDGLPKTQVISLFQDREGFLWIGTKSGLARYDGISFSTYTVKDGLHGGIGSIMQLPDGRMLVCSYRGFYFIKNNNLSTLFTDKRYQFYFVQAVLLKNKAYAVVRSSDPAVRGHYIISFDCASGRFQVLDSFAAYWPIAKLDEETAIVYLEDKSSYVILSNEAIIQRKRLPITFAARGKSYDGYSEVVADSSGNVYTATFRNHEIYFKKIAALKGQFSPICKFLYLARDSSVFYLNAQNGLIRQLHGREEEIIGANNVWQILEDKESNIWVATEDGLYNLFNLQFRKYHFGFEKDKPDFIWSMAQTRDSSFWINSFTSGLWRFDEPKNSLSHVFIVDDSTEQLPGALHYHPVVNNETLFYPGGGGYLTVSANKIQHHITRSYTHMFFYKDPFAGQLISGANGLLRFDGDSFRIWKSASELGIGKMFVLSMCRDKYRRLWYTASGVLGFVDTNDKVTHFDLGEFGTFFCILSDSKGNLWLGGNRGLWFYDYKNWRHFPHPVFSRSVGALHEYKKKYLIVSGMNGMGIVNLDDFYLNHRKMMVKAFTRENGFSVSDYSQNSIWEDLSGTVWVNAPNTLLRFTPGELEKQSESPAVYIQDIHVSSDKTNWQENVANEINIQYPVNNLRFRFVTPAFAYRQSLLYRYRLKGFSDWSYPSPIWEATFTNIPNGKYIFEVQSTADGLRWSDPTIAAINITPIWYQATIFRVLLIAFLSVVVIYIILQTEKTRRRKQERGKMFTELKLKNIRNKATPHFISNVCSNIDYLIVKGKSEEASAYLADFSRLNNKLLLDAEKASRSLKEELEFVNLYLRLEQLRFGDKLKYAIIIEEGVDLNIQLPVMCVHTYTENAIKHGIMSRKGMGCVTIKAVAVNRGTLIEVRDDGIGRSAAKHSNIFSTGEGLNILAQQIDLYNEYNKEKIVQTIADVRDDDGNILGTCCSLFIPTLYQFTKQH